MNLHGIASGIISAVNPKQTIQLLNGISATPGDVYAESTPTYNDPVDVVAQVQPIRSERLRHIRNFNESSIYKAFFISGFMDGLNRVTGAIGDLIVWDSKVWLVVDVPEDFATTAGWTYAIGQLQTDDATKVLANE